MVWSLSILGSRLLPVLSPWFINVRASSVMVIEGQRAGTADCDSRACPSPISGRLFSPARHGLRNCNGHRNNVDVFWTGCSVTV